MSGIIEKIKELKKRIDEEIPAPYCLGNGDLAPL